MKVITEGHRYELMCFDPPLTNDDIQTLQFIEKVPIEEAPINEHVMAALQNTSSKNKLLTVNNGTTNEEVLAVLIDRMRYLQNKFPCEENAIVITKLEESLFWLNKRTRDRQQRNVEGTYQK